MSQQKLSATSATGTPALRAGSLESGLPDSFPRQAFLGVLSDTCIPAAEAWRGLGPNVCSFRTPVLLALAPPTCTLNVRRPGKGRFSDREVDGVGGNMQTGSKRIAEA